MRGLPTGAQGKSARAEAGERMSLRVLIVLVALVLGVTTAPAAAAPVTQSDVTIEASDGVNLSGDVHLPDANGRFPAIVDMEPYGRSSATTYLKDGYAH